MENTDFRCMACDYELFPTYEDIENHSRVCHNVEAEDAVRCAVLLPKILTQLRSDRTIEPQFEIK